MMIFQELSGDQAREAINARQRYQAWRRADSVLRGYRGSMVWSEIKGAIYLVRSAYDPKSGMRRQKSLGPRSPETERMKAEFEEGRRRAKERFEEIDGLLERQAAINRAVGIGRVPLIGAKIIRALDAASLLGRGIRIVGTYALYAYEAQAGVFLDASITTTEDIDLLFDARQGVRIAHSRGVSGRSLMAILRKVDRSFERDQRQTFRAVNRDGYLVDFIKPLPDPPWTNESEQLGGQNDPDLTAAGIEGLRWLENAPLFEAVAIDERGMPLPIAVPDPRVFAAHKLWLSEQADRPALKRRRDRRQAEAVAQMVVQHLPHLPYVTEDLTMLPQSLFDRAKPLFSAGH